MAKLNKSTVKKKITIEIDEPVFNLELSKEEAFAIFVLLSNVTGSDVSPRKITEKLWYSMQMHFNVDNKTYSDLFSKEEDTLHFSDDMTKFNQYLSKVFQDNKVNHV